MVTLKLLRFTGAAKDYDASFNEGVVLTYKTGSTVLCDRTPIWLLDLAKARTRSDHSDEWSEHIPHQAFYSDAPAQLGDIVFKDILSNVSEYVRGTDDFEEYHRIHKALADHTNPAVVPAATPPPRVSKGWALDKFKFLPLHGDAYRTRPDAKWHVSIEDDTFVFWNQLLKWLKTQDHNALRMFGNPAILVNGSVPFMHGGSVYILSRGLLRATYGQDPYGFEHKWDHYVRYSCCGDAELSRAMRIATNSSDLPCFAESRFKFQSESYWRVKFDPRDLCQPIFSLHHVTPFEYAQLMTFKRAMDVAVSENDFIRYIDLFRWMSPQVLRGNLTSAEQRWPEGATSATGWVVQDAWKVDMDGEAVRESAVADVDACQVICQTDTACLMWTFDAANRQCRASRNLSIGRRHWDGTFVTGWSVERIQRAFRASPCAQRPLISSPWAK